MQYAGATFRTWKSQLLLKTDDAHIMMDYRRPGHNQPILQAYARIKNVFEHESYPGGPKRIIVEGSWFDVKGVCPIAKTTLVCRNRENQFNFSSKYVFLTDCHERPVALWPYDPLDELGHGRPEKKWFDVINRNQADDLEKD